MKPLTDWQKIFTLSRVNGQDNCQDLLPVNGWQFPEKSWLQERLKQIRSTDKERRDDK